MIFDSIPVGMLETNCYLIGDEGAGACAVVDPGDDAEKVLDMVRRSGLRLEKILLTHGHFDHVGAAAELAEAAGLPEGAACIHKADAGGKDGRLFPAVGTGLSFWEEGDVVNVGALEVRVLHTPGHSAGSVTLLAGDCMLCGDTLFAGGCGRYDFPDSSLEELTASLARLGRLEGDCKVCPGHGPLSTLERERRTNPYLRQAMGL